eukprot:TRINITY_DN22796_c0_g1_i1.p1 TRINITY_DN22796_c0_g1~~TRINITY_DN22796_c0_g1_i1.p1  ORF type:complete len:111 (-),score=4.42 TRINITY_DN22796_c0_g1_i1:35-367(-)
MQVTGEVVPFLSIYDSVMNRKFSVVEECFPFLDRWITVGWIINHVKHYMSTQHNRNVFMVEVYCKGQLLSFHTQIKQESGVFKYVPCKLEKGKYIYGTPTQFDEFEVYTN